LYTINKENLKVEEFNSNLQILNSMKDFKENNISYNILELPYEIFDNNFKANLNINLFYNFDSDSNTNTLDYYNLDFNGNLYMTSIDKLNSNNYCVQKDDDGNEYNMEIIQSDNTAKIQRISSNTYITEESINFKINDNVIILFEDNNVLYNQIKTLTNEFITFENDIDIKYEFFIIKKITLKYTNKKNNDQIKSDDQIKSYDNQYLCFSSKYLIKKENLTLKDNSFSKYFEGTTYSDSKKYSYYELIIDVYLEDILLNAYYSIDGHDTYITLFPSNNQNNYYTYGVAISSSFKQYILEDNYLVINNKLQTTNKDNEILNYKFLFPFTMLFNQTSSVFKSSFYVNENHIDDINANFNLQKIDSNAKLDTTMLKEINELVISMNAKKKKI
jgi:hypothetical protein